jgi:ATP-dependent RNA helicase DeaD
MSSSKIEQLRFSDLGLNPRLNQSLEEIGYETPSPIQAQSIPCLMAGKDLVGQAQTGTGKTAAFALPLLSRLNLKETGPLIFVLTPTRELAIQVAEAFQRYAAHLKGFHVLPVYGGSDMNRQLRQLKRGVHVVVGTPGRVMDHMRRGTLKLNKLKALVLDEADEMLRMGFIDDVEWILEQTPSTRQTALFSATMPKPIRDIARKYLKNPEEITIKVNTMTAETINQRYCLATGMKKLDVLTRILESEDCDGVLIFVRTKHSTKKLAEKLAARGYACAALNGDIAQKTREKTVDQLKKGKLDIVVATDVAARGLDVRRISHVINFDIPHDPEAYIHRIGRTGRAGCSGEAILFVADREMHLLKAIERATKQKITLMVLPGKESASLRRQEQFKAQIQAIFDEDDLKTQYQLLKEYQKDWGRNLEQIAAALLKLIQAQSPVVFLGMKNEPSLTESYKTKKQKKQLHKKNMKSGKKWKPKKNVRYRS